MSLDIDNESFSMSTLTEPYIIITEQPAPYALRYRYQCGDRTAGSMIGVSSTADNKTYPTVQIVGYKGKAQVKVSCVTKDELQPHPHKLVGPGNHKNGYLIIYIDNDTMTKKIQNLEIQCVRKKDVKEALLERKEFRIDSFEKGFEHIVKPSLIDLKALRLGFQARLFCEKTRKYSIKIKSIASDIIYDTKGIFDLVICQLSHVSASVKGGDKMILLCEKLKKDDIQVRFFEGGNSNWKCYADFKPSDVHKQVAITIKTPKYKTTETDGPVNVWIQLKNKSDGTCSEAIPFMLIPVDSDPIVAKKKRLSMESDSFNQLQRINTQPSSYTGRLVKNGKKSVIRPNECRSLNQFSNFTTPSQPSPISNLTTSSLLHDHTNKSIYEHKSTTSKGINTIYQTPKETANQHGSHRFEKTLNGTTNTAAQSIENAVTSPDDFIDFNQLSNSCALGQPPPTTKELYYSSQNTSSQINYAPKATITTSSYPTNGRKFNFMDTSNTENSDNVMLNEIAPLTTIDYDQSNSMNATNSNLNHQFLDFKYAEDLQDKLSSGFNTSFNTSFHL